MAFPFLLCPVALGLVLLGLLARGVATQGPTTVAAGFTVVLGDVLQTA